MLWERLEHLLDMYTLEEILEFNDLEDKEVLEILFTLGYIEFPTEPVG